MPRSRSRSQRDGSRRLYAFVLGLGFFACTVLSAGFAPVPGRVSAHPGFESQALAPPQGSRPYGMSPAAVPAVTTDFESRRTASDHFDVPSHFAGSGSVSRASGLGRIYRPFHPDAAAPHAPGVSAGFLTDHSTAPPRPIA